MIRVKIRKIQADYFAYNAAKTLAKTMEENHRKDICDLHPNKMSYMIITVRGTGMKLSKGSFCCREFSDKIKIK